MHLMEFDRETEFSRAISYSFPYLVNEQWVRRFENLVTCFRECLVIRGLLPCEKGWSGGDVNGYNPPSKPRLQILKLPPTFVFSSHGTYFSIDYSAVLDYITEINQHQYTTLMVYLTLSPFLSAGGQS